MKIRTNRHKSRVAFLPRTRQTTSLTANPHLGTVVTLTEAGYVAASADQLRALLQFAEDVLLDPRATMHERGAVAARIAVHLAEQTPVHRHSGFAVFAASK